MPLLFLYLMSRPGASHALDFSQLFAKPTRTLGWLLLGNSIVMFWKIIYVAQTRQRNAQLSFLNQRVAQNEHTHAILKTTKFHLSTRKMGLWEVNP